MLMSTNAGENELFYLTKPNEQQQQQHKTVEKYVSVSNECGLLSCNVFLL